MNIELDGFLVTLERPVMMRTTVIKAQALVLEQVTGMTRRRVTAQVIRAGHHPALESPYSFTDDVLTDHRRSETHGHIDLLAQQVTDLVAQRHAYFQSRMAMEQSAQMRRDDSPTKLDGDTDP
ncbi:hypothetical protein D3C76_1435660 [compost metagenome]